MGLADKKSRITALITPFSPVVKALGGLFLKIRKKLDKSRGEVYGLQCDFEKLRSYLGNF
jgi:hypothetical protein